MRINGTFYFTKTKSGNLLGEFINNGLKNFIVESANIDEGFCKEKFEAEYVTNWLEDEKTFVAKLIIVRNLENTKMFNLIWYDLKSNKPIFSGIGFKKKKILIGKYSDQENNERPTAV